MAEQKIKFKVSIKELSFEFEGTRDVGQALQAGLSRSIGGLLETQRTVMAMPAVPAFQPADSLTDGVVAPAEQPSNGQQHTEKAKKPRKASGVSLTKLLRELKTEGFFTEPRTTDAIQGKLEVKGHIFTTTNIAARILDLTKKGEIHRQPNGDGYTYKDTAFDEIPRTPNSSAEPAE